MEELLKELLPEDHQIEIRNKILKEHMIKVLEAQLSEVETITWDIDSFGEQDYKLLAKMKKGYKRELKKLKK